LDNKWFEDNLQKNFPNAYFKGKRWYHVLFHKETLSPETSREELEKRFRETVFKVLEKLLPRLVELHKEGKL